MSSKRDEDSQADLEVGMTTAERRRRRRRGGGLRVPSDNVPRRNTSPPVVAPVPEDPSLAMSIAYSFTSDGSEPVPRISQTELAAKAHTTGQFEPIAPEAMPTQLDPTAPVPASTDPGPAPASEAAAAAPAASGGDEGSFETKTREMSAVDLDALGLSELAAQAGLGAGASNPGMRVPIAPAAAPTMPLPVTPDRAMQPPPSTGASGAFSVRASTSPELQAPKPSDSSVSIDPSLFGGVVEAAVDDTVAVPPVRPSEVDIDVDNLAETTLDTPAPAEDAEPVTSRLATLPTVGSPATTAPMPPPVIGRAHTQPPPPPVTPPPGGGPIYGRAQTQPPTPPPTKPSRAQTVPPIETSSPQITVTTQSGTAIVPPGAMTQQSMAAVSVPTELDAPADSAPIFVDEPSEESGPATAAPAADPAARAPKKSGRQKTLILSDDDVEEMRETVRAIRGASEGAAPAASAPSATPGIEASAPAAAVAAAAAEHAAKKTRSTEPLSIPDIEVQELAERAADTSGDIVVDVADAVEVKARKTPPSPPPPGDGAAGRRPASVPPPIGNSALAAGAPIPATAPGAAHASPPPPPPAAAKAPAAPPAPPPPAQAKKAASPAPQKPLEAKTPKGKPWFVDLFDEDYLRTLPFLTPQATQAEAEFVIDAMGLSPGAQVLDVGCGYGRHAMELAARGMHVVGLDLSTPLLVRGGEEAHRRGLTINFIRGDMRELEFDAQFDGAYCLFSTFGYFDDETNKKAAQNIARALKPGGKVLIEILNRDYVIQDLPTRVWWEGDGCVVLEEVELNYFSSRIQVNRSVVFDDGRQLEQEISVRAYSLHEVGKLMHSAGFRVLEVSGAYQTRGRFFGNQSRHILVLAERTATK